jgi:hypothetical protein
LTGTLVQPRKFRPPPSCGTPVRDVRRRTAGERRLAARDGRRPRQRTGQSTTGPLSGPGWLAFALGATGRRTVTAHVQTKRRSCRWRFGVRTRNSLVHILKTSPSVKDSSPLPRRGSPCPPPEVGWRLHARRVSPRSPPLSTVEHTANLVLDEGTHRDKPRQAPSLRG